MTDIDNIYLIACKNNYNNIIDNINLTDINEYTINKSLKYLVKNTNINILDRLYAYNILNLDVLLYIVIDNNNLEVLEWIHNNYDINKYIDNLIHYIISNKKYNILDWFHNNNFNIKNYKYYILDACNSLDFSILYWFRDNEYLDKFYDKVMKNKDWISEYKLNYHAKAIIDWFYDNYKY
jgi:hypothetical protein